jgi:type IV secretion system protein VirB6
MGDMIGSLLGFTPLAYADPGAGAGQFVFFAEINNFLRNEIDIFQWNLLQRTTLIVGSSALALLTLWILIQGYRIISGQSREPMMALVGDALRAVLIITVATGMATFASPIYWTLTDGTSNAITTIVTGSNQSTFQAIDDNLAAMQGAMSVIDTLNPGGDSGVSDAKDRAMWFTGIGIAGPGVVAGAMLLLNKIALALFIGFGPLFVLSLLFPQTKSLFSRWLFYGIGTMFSLGVLSVMVSLAMRMVAAVTAAFVTNYLVAIATSNTASTEGINSMALQQGGLGLLLSTLIIMAPPIAAAFFQGTLANFAASSSFGQVGRYSTGQGGARPAALGGPPHGYGHSAETRDGDASAGNAPLANNLALGARTPSTASIQEDKIKRDQSLS